MQRKRHHTIYKDICIVTSFWVRDQAVAMLRGTERNQDQESDGPFTKNKLKLLKITIKNCRSLLDLWLDSSPEHSSKTTQDERERDTRGGTTSTRQKLGHTKTPLSSECASSNTNAFSCQRKKIERSNLEVVGEGSHVKRPGKAMPFNCTSSCELSILNTTQNCLNFSSIMSPNRLNTGFMDVDTDDSDFVALVTDEWHETDLDTSEYEVIDSLSESAFVQNPCGSPKISKPPARTNTVSSLACASEPPELSDRSTDSRPTNTLACASEPPQLSDRSTDSRLTNIAIEKMEPGVGAEETTVGVLDNIPSIPQSLPLVEQHPDYSFQSVSTAVIFNAPSTVFDTTVTGDDGSDDSKQIPSSANTHSSSIISSCKAVEAPSQSESDVGEKSTPLQKLFPLDNQIYSELGREDADQPVEADNGCPSAGHEGSPRDSTMELEISDLILPDTTSADPPLPHYPQHLVSNLTGKAAQVEVEPLESSVKEPSEWPSRISEPQKQFNLAVSNKEKGLLLGDTEKSGTLDDLHAVTASSVTPTSHDIVSTKASTEQDLIVQGSFLAHGSKPKETCIFSKQVLESAGSKHTTNFLPSLIGDPTHKSSEIDSFCHTVMGIEVPQKPFNRVLPEQKKDPSNGQSSDNASGPWSNLGIPKTYKLESSDDSQMANAASSLIDTGIQDKTTPPNSIKTQRLAAQSTSASIEGRPNTGTSKSYVKNKLMENCHNSNMVSQAVDATDKVTKLLPLAPDNPESVAATPSTSGKKPASENGIAASTSVNPSNIAFKGSCVTSHGVLPLTNQIVPSAPVCVTSVVASVLQVSEKYLTSNTAADQVAVPACNQQQLSNQVSKPSSVSKLTARLKKRTKSSKSKLVKVPRGIPQEPTTNDLCDPRIIYWNSTNEKKQNAFDLPPWAKLKNFPKKPKLSSSRKRKKFRCRPIIIPLECASDIVLEDPRLKIHTSLPVNTPDVQERPLSEELSAKEQKDIDEISVGSSSNPVEILCEKEPIVEDNGTPSSIPSMVGPPNINGNVTIASLPAPLNANASCFNSGPLAVREKREDASLFPLCPPGNASAGCAIPSLCPPIPVPMYRGRPYFTPVVETALGNLAATSTPPWEAARTVKHSSLINLISSPVSISHADDPPLPPTPQLPPLPLGEPASGSSSPSVSEHPALTAAINEMLSVLRRQSTATIQNRRDISDELPLCESQPVSSRTQADELIALVQDSEPTSSDGTQELLSTVTKTLNLLQKHSGAEENDKSKSSLKSAHAAGEPERSHRFDKSKQQINLSKPDARLLNSAVQKLAHPAKEPKVSPQYTGGRRRRHRTSSDEKCPTKTKLRKSAPKEIDFPPLPAGSPPPSPKASTFSTVENEEPCAYLVGKGLEPVHYIEISDTDETESEENVRNRRSKRRYNRYENEQTPPASVQKATSIQKLESRSSSAAHKKSPQSSGRSGRKPEKGKLPCCKSQERSSHPGPVSATSCLASTSSSQDGSREGRSRKKIRENLHIRRDARSISPDVTVLGKRKVQVSFDPNSKSKAPSQRVPVQSRLGPSRPIYSLFEEAVHKSEAREAYDREHLRNKRSRSRDRSRSPLKKGAYERLGKKLAVHSRPQPSSDHHHSTSRNVNARLGASDNKSRTHNPTVQRGDNIKRQDQLIDQDDEWRPRSARSRLGRVGYHEEYFHFNSDGQFDNWGY